MKKILFLIGAAALVLCVSCNKEKQCRCAVVGTQTVRIITITSGRCDQIHHASQHDALDTLHTDYLLCTDYPFAGDSLIVNH
jgi:hypothetical protein